MYLSLKMYLPVRIKTLSTLVFFCLVVFSPQGALAKEKFVSSQAEYQKAAGRLRAGDTIILKNGIWKDFQIVFMGKGKKNKPITLTAETKGRVIISGESNLRLAGKYLVVSGLVFKDGYSPSSEVISFKKDSKQFAYHSRVTEVVVDNFNKPKKFETDYWVGLYGKHNRFDHSNLVGKKNRGVTLAVRLNSDDNLENHHRIDHNYFGPRQVFASNGGETMRIGTSKYSLSNSNTVVENNFFDRCNGEVEVISNKSGGNIFRNNVFYESRGTLTLRHGNGNVVENNVFLGNHVDHTGGIRVINADQIVRNNYMYGLTGYRFGGAFVVMNGVYDSPINRYHQVKNATIENNSIIDSDHIQLAAGSDQERQAVPIDSVMKNNLFYHSSKKDIFTVYDDISGILFTNNALVGVNAGDIKAGVKSMSSELAKASNGLLYPVSESLSGIGVSKELSAMAKKDAGAPWYPKADPEAIFERAEAMQVQSGAGSLSKAIALAPNGGILELAEGTYSETESIRVEKAMTIRPAAGAAKKVKITFSGDALFSWAEGGNLSLEGLDISGAASKAPADVKNVIHMPKSMLTNYNLIVKNCNIHSLNTIKNFNFMTVSKNTVADKVVVEGSSFSYISGHVLSLDKESDDKGMYNAEYVTITGSKFKNIDGPLINLYRGGKDESTFGPHFELSGSTLENVGKGSGSAAIMLHGVQVTKIKNSSISKSAEVVIIHTVGEPVTKIIGNIFRGVALPKVTELVSKKTDTALFRDNKTQ